MHVVDALSVWMTSMNVLLMSPVAVDRGRNEVKVRTGRRYFTYCAIVATANVYMFYDGFVSYMSTIGFEKLVEVLYTFSSGWIVCSFAVRFVTGYNGNRERLARTLRTLVWIDDRLGRLRRRIDSGRLERTVRFELVALALLWLYRVFVSIVFFEEVNVHCFWHPQVFYVVEILFFYNNVWMTRECFRSIGDCLGSIRDRSERVLEEESSIVRDVLVAKRCYERAVECAETLNGIFGWRNLNYSINMFFETSVLIFMLLKKMLRYDVRIDTSLEFRMCLMLWPFFLVSFFAKLVQVCSETDDEARRVGRVACDVARTCDSDRIRSRLHVAALQVLHQPRLFHVKGLFDLDAALLHQIVCATSACVITYWNIDLPA